MADAAITKRTDESTRFGSSSGLNNGASRWGVRGTENLGGGLTAAFNYEAGLNLENGSIGQSGGNFFSRAANLSLAGEFGSVLLGRGKSPSGQAVPVWELTGDANYSVAVKQFGYGGESGSRNRATAATDSAAAAGTDAKYDLNVIYKGDPLAASLAYNTVENGGAKGYVLGAKYDIGAFQVASSYTDSDKAGGAINSRGFTLWREAGGHQFGA